MSAILGRFQLDNSPVDPVLFGRGMDALAHYQAERVDVWIEDGIALGCRLREFTPESRFENQPVVHERAVIVADARIDNRDELFDALGVPHPERAEMPDSTLILRAYLQWGEDCTARLIGDFAFAIYDRSRRAVFCARDHVGVRPLVFVHTPAVFTFATDPAALLAFADQPHPIDEHQVATYLQDWFVLHKDRTFYQGIDRLPQATQFTVTGQGITRRTHWKPEMRAPLVLKDAREYGERLRGLMEEAIRARIRSAYPIASHFSGGIDSSSISILAKRTADQTGGKFAMGYSWSPPISDENPEVQGDERLRIWKLAEAENLPAHFVYENADNYRAFFARNIAADSRIDLFFEKTVLPDAGSRGVRMILSGSGGDEAATTPGQGYLAELLVRGRFRALARFFYHRFRFNIRATLPQLFQHVLLPILPGYFFRKFGSTSLERFPLGFINPDFKRAFGFKRYDIAFREHPGFHSMIAMNIERGHLAERMEGWNKWGAPYGIQYAFPMTDKRIFEFMLAVPPDVMFGYNTSRLMYRQAMTGVFPPSVANDPFKTAPASERYVLRLQKQVFERVQAEFHRGEWGDTHPWLDLPRFRAELDRQVPTLEQKSQSYWAIIFQTAVEAGHLWRYNRNHTD